MQYKSVPVDGASPPPTIAFTLSENLANGPFQLLAGVAPGPTKKQIFANVSDVELCRSNVREFPALDDVSDLVSNFFGEVNS